MESWNKIQEIDYQRFVVKPESSGGYNFWCSGCNEVHNIPLVGNCSYTVFNGNLFKPSFLRKNSQLIQIFATRGNEGICIYNIDNGIINYMTNCHHYLAGFAVELREYKDWDYITIKWKPGVKCIMPNCDNHAVKGSNLCESH